MGNILGEMGSLLKNIEGEWGEPIPHIQSLVVQKSGPFVGLPDDGISEFWEEYPKLSKPEKFEKVYAEYERIKEFGSRWNKVLSALELKPIKEKPGTKASKRGRFGGSGESPRHSALKEYVRDNPRLVGADVSSIVILEYPLPSGDVVDLLFKCSNRWIAVEVKSKVSDRSEWDYRRGLYQCVKYRAVLEAMREGGEDGYGVPDSIEVILLLESKLPNQYSLLAENLAIKVLEKIKVSKAPP